MFRNLCAPALGVSGRESELIELALSFGFRGMDLDLADLNSRVAQHGLAHARRLSDSAKLQLASVGLPVDVEADDATFAAEMAALPGLLDAASQMGCRAALTTLAPATDLRPYHENFELHRKRYGEIAAALAPLKMKLGIEFRAAAEERREKHFEFIHDFSALQVLLSTVGADNVGVVLDNWQLYASGAAPDAWRKLPANQIVSVYLADAPEGVAPEALTNAQRALPGTTGVIDSVGLLTGLAELGYQGPVAPAPGPQAAAGQTREAIVRAAGQALDAVWKAAGLSPSGKLTATAGK